jgi:cholesterol oxidase
VLLVHGASAGSDTFRINERQTLVDYLLRERFDVWTLDWRASMRCARNVYCTSVAPNDDAKIFTIDAAALHDVPAAIAGMRARGVQGKIAIVGHCMGGAIVTQGIVQGVIPIEDVETVVLTALGLFYRAAIDNILKVEDQVLEQLLASKQYLLHPTKRWDLGVCAHDPVDGPWDPLLEVPYGFWLDTLLPHECTNHLCHRLSYMFGMPYRPDDMPTIHDHALGTQFGYIPLQLLLHCCQNLRRGHGGQYVADSGGLTLPRDERYLRREAFRGRAVTLITGDVNSLWHRDSIDTMDEWLRRGRRADRPRTLRKHVLADYAHQDLYWASKAPSDVFSLIRDGLLV